MAMGRGQNRFSAIIWPGFVDVMTALILVLFFVLSIFMIVQFVLRDTITGQGQQLDELSLQVANLADALGLERSRADRQAALVSTLTGERDAAQAEIGRLSGEKAAAEAQVAALIGERDTAAARIADFEAQVASLLARNTDITGRLEATEAARSDLATRLESTEAARAGLAGQLQTTEAARADLAGRLESAETARADLGEELETTRAESADRFSANQALQLALAQARAEIDEGAETARLAAARREALEALVASLRGETASLQQEVDRQAVALSDAETTRLTEAAAAEELRRRLQASDAELTAMTLNLEEQRRQAEETLTLLAAAEAARDDLQATNAAALSEADRRQAELAQARTLLAEERQVSSAAQRQLALLNQQTAELRTQLDGLQGLLDEAEARDTAAQVQIELLGSNLNAALARVAAEERARAELEARERARLEEEAKDLENYRSEFFGRMSAILGEREGVQVVGDRFVFPSEVLFAPGSATLGGAGQAQVARVAQVIREIADEIPPEINWVLRVDGHTDNTPVSFSSPFSDNWELSAARALSVVRYMNEAEGIPAERLAATGFGEYQPIDLGNTPEALARNRRIELKFTER